MLLAVTNHVTQNVAAIPLLWLAPLTLYLLTFILAFEGGLVPLGDLLELLPGLADGHGLAAGGRRLTSSTCRMQLGMFLSGLFVDLPVLPRRALPRCGRRRATSPRST